MDKKEQKKLITEVMNADAKDGLYKQTAVEWLALRYHHRQGYLSQEDIEQAKQMEREQIVNAYSSDRFPCSDDDAEQYYNETYNK